MQTEGTEKTSLSERAEEIAGNCVKQTESTRNIVNHKVTFYDVMPHFTVV